MDAQARGPVLVTSPARARILAKPGVILLKGRPTLANTGRGPQEAMVDDLLAVRDALESAGIEFMLIRGDNSRPILVVDRRRRDAVAAALTGAFSDEPFYSKIGGGPALLVADGSLALLGKARIVRLYRPRVELAGNLRYGARNGVQLEFWKFGSKLVAAPEENSLTRHRIPASEIQHASVSLFGRDWVTLEGMFATHISDITFPIDMVFSWVDGTAIEFQRARALRMQAYVVGEGDESEARYRQIDELKYALRSVYLFAPWVRKIFIATDSPVPEWLADHDRVTIVRSEEFFRDPSVLPTHNSQAVESQLHRIPGLSEHFIYSNDDMFFGRPVSPDMFFSPGGVTKFIEATTRIGLGANDPARSGFENSARVNRSLLLERFGRVTTRHLEHTATPLRKSVLFELEEQFAQDFERTAASTFRSSTDISVTNSLYHFYALMTGRAVVQTQARVKYVETTLRRSLKEMDALLKRRSCDFFCLNDGSAPEITVELRTTAVRSFLERYFPVVAPWETAVSGAATDGVDGTALRP